MITLIPLSALCGIVTGLVFRRFGSGGLRQTVNRLLAHLMELRLFLDEPALVWRAQRDLLRENLRMFRQIALPCLITAPLMALVLWQGDLFYGHGPLRAGEAVVITSHDLNARLDAPADVVVESPGVRIPRLTEVSWRVRPLREFGGSLGKNIDIPWPRASVFGVSWVVWFFGISALAAFGAAFVSKPLSILTVLMFVQPVRAADKTPVFLISIDTLRADHAGAYGYTKIRTPNIDSLAQGGTVYEHIDTQIPLTLPSHTVLMTSTYPFANHVEANDESVPAGAVTLASVLRANGYKTAAFIGSMILDKRYGLDQGFDVYDSPFGNSRVRRDAALVTRAALQWLEGHHGEPVFAFLHFYDLHTPYTLPQVAGLTPTIAGYDAELKYADEVLGRLRDGLIRDGLWDKALVILVADHGESLGDHGETSHGYFIYESTMHVPLIVHWPAGAGSHPARSAEGGGLIDVAPTVLEFLHIAAPASFAGVSLLSGHERSIYGESVYAQENFGWAALRSLQSGAFKFIDAPRAELYDLLEDPGERVNVLGAHAEQGRALKSRLDAIVPTGSQGAPKPGSGSARAVLGSLGYTSGGRAAALGHVVDPKDRIGEQEAFEGSLTLLYSGQYAKALVALGKIVKQDPDNTAVLCALGEAYLRSGDSAHALASWQKALERDPKNRTAAESIGGYWLARGNPDKACGFVPAAPQCKGR